MNAASECDCGAARSKCALIGAAKLGESRVMRIIASGGSSKAVTCPIDK